MAGGGLDPDRGLGYVFAAFLWEFFMPDPIMARVSALLSKREANSRNRNFNAYASQEGQQVFRLYRLYLSLLSEIEQAAGRPEMVVKASSHTGGLMLELTDPKVAYCRRTLVPPELSALFKNTLKSLGYSG